MSHDLTSFHVSHGTHKWIPGHMKMSLVTHTNKSCYTYTWVLSHSHRIHRNEPCHTTSHVTRGNRQAQVTKTRGKGSLGVISTCHSESHPPKKLRGSRVSIPYIPFYLICTISSEQRAFLICTHLSEPGLISADFRWTGSTPTGFQEGIHAGKDSSLVMLRERNQSLRVTHKDTCHPFVRIAYV